MNQVALDSAEMKSFLRHMISNNRKLQTEGKVPVSTEIIGDSGLGKTSIALQLANELGLNFVKLNLAQIEELGDLVGFPIRQFELSKGNSNDTVEQPVAETKFQFEKVIIDGKQVLKKVPVKEKSSITPTTKNETMWIDENAVEEFVKNGWNFTGKKRMSYCPPEWIADKQGGGILILDDYNRKIVNK